MYYNKRADCKYYEEDNDMGAIIPICHFENSSIMDCICEDCPNYISKWAGTAIEKTLLNFFKEETK